MKSYLLIDSSGIIPPSLNMQSLLPGLLIIWDARDPEAITQELRNAGAFSAQSALLELSHPFETVGLSAKARDRWETAMLHALGNSIQGFGEEWLHELRDAA
ncbi:MAG: hypothetical protein Q7S40_25235 [Opitutaceae bacterium]|nr:hypothetical protein [Opitutaceae bacterium]